MTTYNGTLQRGTPYFVAGQFGNALTGGGVYTTANLPNSALGTFEVWLKVAATGDIRVAFGSESSNTFWIGKDASEKVAFQRPGGSLTSGSITIGDNTWHHVAATVDGTNFKVWVDGALAATVSYAGGLILASDSTIGALSTAHQVYDWPTTGLIDEIRISNVVRYPSTFTRPSSAFNSDANTLALYHLNSDATDSSGTGTVTSPSIGTITISTAGGTDTITYPAPAAGTNPVGGVALYAGTASGAESGTAYATNTGTAGGTFTHPATTSPNEFYYVKAFDNAATPNFSSASNEVNDGTATTTVSANDGNLLYSPGVWDVNSARAKTINAGAYVKGLFLGGATSLAWNFDISADAAPIPEIVLSIDGQVIYTGNVAATITTAVPTTTTATKHYVELTVKSTTETQSRWSPQSTGVSLTSVIANIGGATTGAVQRRPLRGLVFGDSITEGVRTLGQTQTNDTDRNDATLGWAYLLGRVLGAEIGVVGFGATGLTVAGSGGVPALPSSYNLMWGSGPARPFTGLDFVVIHEGTNDGSSNTTAALTAVINALLTACDAKTTIVVLRPFNGTAQANNLQAAIAACTTPSRVHYTDTTGWLTTADTDTLGLHPTGQINLAQIAPLVAGAIRLALPGAKTVVSWNGTAWV